MTIAERRAAVDVRATDWAAGVAAELAPLLGDAIEAALGRGGATLAAVSLAVGACDPVDLFAAGHAAGLEPTLLLRPDEGVAFVALGATWRVRTSGEGRFEETAAAWSDLTSDAIVSAPDGIRGVGPLLLGGASFAAHLSDPEVWRGFSALDMVLPRLLLSVTPAGAWVTASALVADDASAALERERSREVWELLESRAGFVVADQGETAPRDPSAPRHEAVATDEDEGQQHEVVLRVAGMEPGAEEWQATVARLAGAVGRGRVDKVVLARQVSLDAGSPIEVDQVLRRLAVSASDSTVFAVTRGTRTFLGATPELLIRRQGRVFRTMALAGSTPRGDGAVSDAQLAEELLGSDKEHEEHAVVVRMLREDLSPLADSLDVDERPSVLRLRHVQHLATAIAGRLREPLGILELVSRLHPTPAVGGAPRDLALELIEDAEVGERGWYAGPLGWVDRIGDGEFVVALRSGVIDGSRATLFAGCGIVADSDPEREWQESEAKLRALATALGRIEA